MRKLILVSILSLNVLIASGCATKIKYNFDKELFVNSSPKEYSVVVDVFEDSRPDREKEGKLYGKDGYAISKDKMFKKNIPLQVSQMLSEHLMKARIFDKVMVMDVSNNLESKADEMLSLKNKGYDLAVIGKLNHFYGYYSDEVSAMTSAALFGLVGAIVEAVANPKTVGGKVEYGDLKIIHLNDGKILWSGNVEHAFEKEEKFYDSPTGYVLKALKETNNKFSRELSLKDL